jgi:hypothetical protein
LLDTILQRADHRALVTQPGQPRARLLVLGILDGQQHDLDRLADVGGICQHWTGNHDRILVLGPDDDRVARGTSVQRYGVARGVQQGRDRRPDGAGSDECDAGAW